MGLESLKRKVHILRSLSRLRRIKGVMKRKQVKQLWKHLEEQRTEYLEEQREVWYF